MKCEHHGTEITLNERTGNFEAFVNGKVEKRSSLAGMRKLIDEAAKNAFKPFRALHIGMYASSVDEVDVIGIKVPRANERNQNIRFECKLVKKERYRDTFDTETIFPMSAKADIEKLVAWHEETEDAKSKRDEQERNMRKQLVPLKPTDFMKGK